MLQLDTRGLEHEYQVLEAVESIAVPTPRAFGLDMQGEALGVPCFFSEFIEGDSLLEPMQAGETWAENLYLDTVCTLKSAYGGRSCCPSLVSRAGIFRCLAMAIENG